MKKINNQAELKKMANKYVSGKATPEEEKFLEAYFQSFENSGDITAQLSEDEKLQLKTEMEVSIMEKISAQQETKVRILPIIMRVAAAVLIFITAGIYFFHSKSGKTNPGIVKTHNNYKNDIAPGGNKALLTLADGTKISLDDAKIGELTKQGNAVITKAKDGQLIYDLSNLPDKSQHIANNTIETPRGGEYQVVLPDGTKVWLNAASKLMFPTAFKGKERRVELIGEAYFEVAKNKNMPFRVASGSQIVEVLGTHFNVNAYSDELSIKTTLLEGSVSVSKAGTSISKLLKPGQQSTIVNGQDIVIATVNTKNVVAWKNGYFVFANETVESVMRKVSRWYDIDVEYNGSITKEKFTGSVSRFEKISEVLGVLELTGLVHFKIDGRRVIDMP